MHPSGSFLKTVLERVRAYVNEPDADAKFKDEYVIRSIISPALDEVVGRITMTENCPVICRFSLTLSTSQEYYILPCAREIIRIVQMDEYKNVVFDWRPESDHNPGGPGWVIEGNTIRFNPLPAETETLDIWYIPDSAVVPHYSADGGACSVDGTTFTLDSTPTLGFLDQRENAYAGLMLRYLPASGIWQERIITSYDPSTRVATLRRPLSSIPGTRTSLPYEIAPIYHASLWEAVATRSAMKLAAMNRQSNPAIDREYAASLKTARDLLSNFNSRRVNRPVSSTLDAPENDFSVFWSH